MEFFLSINFLLLVLAFSLSAVLVICCNGIWALRKKVHQKSDKKEHAIIIFEAFMAELGDDWVFVDSLPDALFLSQNEKVKRSLYIFFGRESDSPFLQLLHIEGLVKEFERKGLIQKAEVAFSRENLISYPELFDSLPDWRRDECQMKLLASSGKHVGERLVQIRKMPGQE